MNETMLVILVVLYSINVAAGIMQENWNSVLGWGCALMWPIADFVNN